MTTKEKIQLAKEEIIKDIVNGIIPCGVSSFSQLNDYVNIIKYGNDDDKNKIQEALDFWIKNELTNDLKKLEDEDSTESFIYYWKDKDAEEIVSFLYDVDFKELNEVINIETSIDYDEEWNYYEVIKVDYLQNKNKSDLLNLMRKFNDELLSK